VKCDLGNNEVVLRIRLHIDLGLFLLNLTGSCHTTIQELYMYPQAILGVSLAAVALCHFCLPLLLRVLLSTAQFLGFGKGKGHLFSLQDQ